MSVTAGSDGHTGAVLQRRLGLLAVYAISTGAMVAPGIFLLPGLAAAEAGAGVIVAYLLAGLLAIPTMLSVAELSTAMPRAGGPYYFLDRSLGPLIGTVGGLGMWAALMLKTAFALVGLSAYLGLVVDVAVVPTALVLTAGFTVLNVIGVRKSSWLQVALVGVLVVFLALFVVAGLAHLLGQAEEAGQRFSPLVPTGFNGLVSTTGMVFFSYAGLTQVASIAEEVRRPERTLPLGMLLALLSALVFYVGGVTAMVGLEDPQTLAADLTPVASVTELILPGVAGLAAVTLAAVAGFAATGNAGILGAARYPFAMARDHLLSGRLATLGRFGTPTLAVVATGGVMAAVIVLLDVTAIAELASAFILLVFALLNLAVMVMRASRIPAYDPAFRSPLYPYTQLLGVAATGVLVIEIGWLSMLFTLGMMTGCYLWWRWWARHRVARHGAVYHWFDRLSERRDDRLDAELVGIVQEQGLREEDRFDEIVARALVTDTEDPVTEDRSLELACRRLAEVLDLDPSVLSQRARRNQIGLGGAAILASALVDGPLRPEMAMVRGPAHSDAAGSDGPLALFLIVGGRDSAGTVLRSLAQLASHVEGNLFEAHWLDAGDEQEMKEALLRDERLLSLRLEPGNPADDLVGHRLRDLPLPHGALVALVRRDGQILVPDGETDLRVDDRLTIVGNPTAVSQVAGRYGTHRS
jgi:amino acid transporter